MKKILYLVLLSTNFLSAQFNPESDKKIKGKWEFKVFSDSIAFPMIDGIKTENKIFVDKLEFKNNNIFTSKSKGEKINGQWTILGNNLILNFENKTSILYEIMRLNDSRLELKEEGMVVSNLGYDKKSDR